MRGRSEEGNRLLLFLSFANGYGLLTPTLISLPLFPPVTIDDPSAEAANDTEPEEDEEEEEKEEEEEEETEEEEDLSTGAI